MFSEASYKGWFDYIEGLMSAQQSAVTSSNPRVAITAPPPTVEQPTCPCLQADAKQCATNEAKCTARCAACRLPFDQSRLASLAADRRLLAATSDQGKELEGRVYLVYTGADVDHLQWQLGKGVLKDKTYYAVGSYGFFIWPALIIIILCAVHQSTRGTVQVLRGYAGGSLAHQTRRQD